MPKKYKLLIDSPEFPVGIIATQDDDGDYLIVFEHEGIGLSRTLHNTQVENRPTVWQEIVEEPKKKTVERWRGSLYETYYRMGHNKSSIPTTERSNHENAKNHANGDYFHCKKTADRAVTRVEIMCRLMGLAETIEEGSTEMKREYALSGYGRDIVIINSYYSCITPTLLATFSTKELAQLFLDSAGQDALDWYGEVR